MILTTAKKQSFDYELIACCWHESGHVICNLHNYMGVDHVSVMTLKDKEGITQYNIIYTSPILDEATVKTMVLLDLQGIYAGLLAEKIYYKEVCGSDKFPMHLKSGSSEDMKNAYDLIRKYKLAEPGQQTIALKKQIQKDVNQLLYDNWDAIKAVAHALYQKKKLNFKDLKHILTRKTDHNDFWKDKFNKIKIIHNEINPPELVKWKRIIHSNIYLNI